MLWTAKIIYVTVGIFILITGNCCASSLTNQSGAQTWEIHSVEQYEYKTDFNLNGGKGFSNGTKQVFVQNKSCLQVQTHKGSNATVCLACFMLEQKHKIISCLQWTRILLFNFCSMLKISKPFSTLSTHFKTFPKTF